MSEPLSSSRPDDKTIWQHAEALYNAWYGTLTPWWRRSQMFREDLFKVAAQRIAQGSSS